MAGMKFLEVKDSVEEACERVEWGLLGMFLRSTCFYMTGVYSFSGFGGVFWGKEV
jgi:hypothetical protein